MIYTPKKHEYESLMDSIPIYSVNAIYSKQSSISYGEFVELA